MPLLLNQAAATPKPRRTGNPIYVLGDSFASDEFLTLLRDHVDPLEVYDDGVSGTTLAQQAARWAAQDSAYYDYTLVMTDDMSGLVATTMPDAATEMIALYDEIIGRLTHTRFLILEPGVYLNATTGTGIRTLRDDKWNALVSEYAGNTVPVLNRMQNLASGTTDNTYVADGLWPLSCITATDNFHPSRKGKEAYAAAAFEALKAKGWLS